MAGTFWPRWAVILLAGAARILRVDSFRRRTIIDQEPKMGESIDLGHAHGRIHMDHIGDLPNDELRLVIEMQVGSGWVLFLPCTFNRATWKEIVTPLFQQLEDDPFLKECLHRDEIGPGVMEALTAV